MYTGGKDLEGTYVGYIDCINVTGVDLEIDGCEVANLYQVNAPTHVIVATSSVVRINNSSLVLSSKLAGGPADHDPAGSASSYSWVIQIKTSDSLGTLKINNSSLNTAPRTLASDNGLLLGSRPGNFISFINPSTGFNIITDTGYVLLNDVYFHGLSPQQATVWNDGTVISNLILGNGVTSAGTVPIGAPLTSWNILGNTTLATYTLAGQTVGPFGDPQYLV